MALSDKPDVLFALLESETGVAESEATKRELFGTLCALFAPDYVASPTSTDALSHLGIQLGRWQQAIWGELVRRRTRATHEIVGLEREHTCIVCATGPKRRTYKRKVTQADWDACPIIAVYARYDVPPMTFAKVGH